MKKKTFTLVEMVIIVVVLGIIVGLTRNLFNTARQDKIIFGENCTNYIYGKITNFIADVTYGKIASGVAIDSIKYYQIRYTTDKIEVGYIVSGTNNFVINDTFLLGTGVSKNTSSWCTSTAFSLANTGTSTMNIVAIPTKGSSLPTIGDKNIRFIGKQDLTNIINTGSIDFYTCDKNILSTTDSSCIGIAKILIDRRSQQFFLHKCLTRDSKTGKCTSRPTVF